MVVSRGLLNPPYIRVFIARSDPAMNYGMLSAVILAKIALSHLSRFSRETGVPVYPIIGVGSLPFRGHFNPENYVNVLREYRGVWTFTIQSAFKYDYPEEEVRRAVHEINTSDPGEAEELSQEEVKAGEEIMRAYTSIYQLEVEGLAQAINSVARHIPRRRARKLHIGLFGYARKVGDIILPRAIPFCGALYSLGIPSELLSLSALEGISEEKWDLLGRLYKGFRRDLEASAKYYNHESLDLIKEIWRIREEVREMIGKDINFLENQLGIKTGGSNYSEKKHSYLLTLLLLAHKEGRIEEAKPHILEMTLIRKSIG